MFHKSRMTVQTGTHRSTPPRGGIWQHCCQNGKAHTTAEDKRTASWTLRENHAPRGATDHSVGRGEDPRREAELRGPKLRTKDTLGKERKRTD